jgi:hypothetical protein
MVVGWVKVVGRRLLLLPRLLLVRSPLPPTRPKLLKHTWKK